ncbi:MAG TPA: NapC/NirT family cytochrome c, partial [Gemmatimonadales bacterium]|nr:NapC/NirT family cytochrome c [Gemmatimonadales bacterium]
MHRLLIRLIDRLLQRWRGLSRRGRIGVLALLTLLAGVVLAGSYKAYNYVEHSNDFCITCHLMQDPFDRFKRSAHAEIECHDCHKSTRIDQMKQLWGTLVMRQAEITRHAQVPNRVCGACHVEGDPQRWAQIAASAGHRVHLESRDSSLRDMLCTDCHSVNVHEFASVDSTCGQAGCHVDNTIRLGGMGQLELHCTACHNFLANAEGLAVDSLGRPLTPRARECLSCHQMQQRVGLLEIGRDPHGGVCGDCHNPHEQEDASQATCTTASCHSDWRALSFHVGVQHPERCTTCHVAHSWRVEGANCTRCHRNIEREPPVRMSSDEAGDAVLMEAFKQGRDTTTRAVPQRRPFPRFSHGSHRNEQCSACHSSRVRHGAVMVRSENDCRRCHHAQPGRENCAACHSSNSLRRATTSDRQVTLAGLRRAVTRRLRFE